MKNILIGFLIILYSFIELFAQDSLSSRALKVINDGMKTYEMKVSDIWLPVDTTENNYHRLKLFDTLFGNPLHSIDLIKYHANGLLNLNEKNFDSYFSNVFSQLEFKQYQPIYYENNLSTREIDRDLGLGTDTTFGVEGGQLFKMFISPVIQIRNLLAEDYLYKKSVRLTFLKENYQKVLLGSFSEESNTGFDSLQKIVKDFFIYSQSSNRSMIYSNGVSLYSTLLKLAQIAKNNTDILKNNIKTKIIETPYGKVALGGIGNDVYEGDFTAIIDIGGNDKYIISNNGNSSPAKFIVDLSGSDTYTGDNFSLGGTAFGINILIDLSGNDTYSAKNFTEGCGIFGVGILNDLSGDDKYSGKIMAQGASAFGIGLLIDNTGNDLYEISSFGQGLALPKGFGLLLDDFGQDVYNSLTQVNPETKTYFSFAQGVSAGYYPYSSGGLGLLVDGRGNDSYKSGICSQGYGYWFGLGALYDLNGFDDYHSYQYSQGASINSGFGILFDNQGNDSYSSEGIAQGFANDNSFALLLDDFGNDFYNIYSPPEKPIEYSQPSISLLLDASASSTFSNYIIADSSFIGKKKIGIFPETKNKDFSFYLKVGFPIEALKHDIREKYGDYNLFLCDTSFKNYYNMLAIIMHDAYRVKLLYDLSQFDFERKLIFTHSKIDTNVFLESIKNKSAEELYSQLMSGHLSVEEINLLKNKIIENSLQVEFLSQRLGTASLFERKNLTDILSGLLGKGNLPVKNLLIDSCESKNPLITRICIDLLSENKIFDIVKCISEINKSSSWYLRAESAKAIWKMGSTSQIDLLSNLIEDKHPYPRASAAYALGKLMPDDVLRRLNMAFFDDFALVRNKAIEGLTENRQLRLDFILKAIETDLPQLVKNKFAGLIVTSIYSKKEMKEFIGNINKLPENIRRIIYNSIYTSGNKAWLKNLKDLKKNEPAEELQNQIERIINSMKKKGK